MENNVFIVDPNRDSVRHLGGGVVTPEHLSISVELKAIKKDRSAIAISKESAVVKLGSNATPISFLGGTDVKNNDGKPSLTTFYTELTNPFNESQKDLETLGMTDIKIEFNSACAPLITIDFVDVRGKLFEMGKNSPYSVFWEMPYPIFELTIKGYYGKAVTYKLHLTKFDGTFDYSTGNFLIKCNFVGYTYALLSDIIMGHLKGIAYTERGRAKIEEKRTQYGDGRDFFTFKELNEVATKVHNEVGDLMREDEGLKAVKKAEDIVKKLQTFRESILSNLKLFKGCINPGIIEGFYAFKSEVIDTDDFTNDIDNYNNLIRDYIKEFNEEGALDDGFKLTESKYLVKYNETLFDSIYKVDFEGGVHEYIENIKDTSRYIEDLEDPIAYERFKDGVVSAQIDIEFTAIVVQSALVEIDDIISRLNTLRASKFEEISENIVKSDVFTDNNGKWYDPTIGNLIRLICDHADILLECIRDVAYEAEKDPNKRASDLRNIEGVLDEVDKDGNEVPMNDNLRGNLKAFPSYSIEKDGVFEDSWIGKVAPNIPEVRFIEALLDGIINARNDDEKTVESEILNNGGVEYWYPVNTFDSPIFGVKNPYKSIEDSLNIDNYLTLIALRAITFFYTNPNASDEKIKTMAKMEANNAFTSMLNIDVKNAMRVYAENGKGNLLNDGQNSNKFKNFQEKYNGENKTIFKSKSGHQIGHDYVYTYIPVIKNSTSTNNSQTTDLILDFSNEDTNVSSLYSHMLLPITTPSTNFKGDFLVLDGSSVLTDSKRRELRDNGQIFISNNDRGSTFDDGSTLLKIIKPETLEDNGGIYPTYGKDVDLLAKPITLGDNPNGGLSNKFLKISVNGVETSIANMFYNNFNDFSVEITKDKIEYPKMLEDTYMDRVKSPNITKQINSTTIFDLSLKYTKKTTSLRSGMFKNEGKVTTYVPHIGFFSNGFAWADRYYSLFGSYLYNIQTSPKAKAYLFLHSIPFDGMRNGKLFDDSSLKNLFTTSGGFVEVPYSWALFVGAVIARYNGDFDVEFGNSNMSYVRGLKKGDYPAKNQYNVSSSNNVRGWFNFDSNEYSYIEGEIQNLPKQAKNEFVKLFNDYVINEFKIIAFDLEPFRLGVTGEEIKNFWSSFNTLIKTNPQAVYSNPILKTNMTKHYKMFVRISDGYGDTDTITSIESNVISKDSGAPYNFLLELEPNSESSKRLNTFLMEKRVIASSSGRIWSTESTNKHGFFRPILADKVKYEKYLEAFFTEYLEITKNLSLTTSEEEKQLKQELFSSINNDDIKLNLYIKIKSLYDKWVCGSEQTYLDVDNGLFSSFRFIDRAYADISDKFKINIVPVIGELTNNYNQSFYSYLSRVLADNNFDFFPLPSYIDYTDKKELETVFKPYTYNNTPESLKPLFICMYMGEKSNALSETFNFKNNSFNLDSEDMPSDFKNGEVPAFLVKYGDPDQSLFKNINISQSEYTATDESLTITNDLATNGNRAASIGQNLYDVYINRSYTCHVEMLGDTMIQPLMYFQLDNIPMFRGAYNIIKVSHSIKPNSMITNFTGVRVRRNKTKMIDDIIIMKDILGDLSNVKTDGANLKYLSTSQYADYITYKLDSNAQLGLVRQHGGVDNYCIEEIGKYIELVAKKWHNYAKNKTHGDTIYYNDLSKFKGAALSSHKTHNGGNVIDFRMVRKDKKNNPITINSNEYDRDATIKLLQMFIDCQKEFKGWKDNRILTEVLTMDNEVINHFRNSGISFRNVPGHDNHLHLVFNYPTRVVESGLTNPTKDGEEIEKINNKSIPTAKEMENYLGLI